MKQRLLKIAMLAVFFMAAMSMGQAQNVPITLNQGWNWISYPYSESMTIPEALSGFTPVNGDVISSQTNGSSTYNNGTWRGSLTTLVPGQGYMYKSVDGTTRTFIFGGAANDPTAIPAEALEGEFTVDANGTKVRFSPGNLQCRVDPTQGAQIRIQVGAGTSTTSDVPYNTNWKYSLSQIIYRADELQAAGLTAGSITGIAFESYSDYHYLRDGIEIWMANTTLTEAPTTSVSVSGMKKMYSGSVTQQTGWTEIAFNSSPFNWDGTSNLIVTVVMNHGSYNVGTPWQCNDPGFTCSYYTRKDGDTPYDPSLPYYMTGTNTLRPNTRFICKSGATWRFAEQQWDYIGEDNANVSATYRGWIDLFGWGTSGHPHGANCWQPWSTSEEDSDYYAYGSESYNLYDQTGEADWGCNPISNGGNQPNQWRTLTNVEWDYVFKTRSTASGIRFAKAKVNGVKGVILLPDNWSTSYYSLNYTNSTNVDFTANHISSSQWQTLEQYGAVFLPAAGNRQGTSVLGVGSGGHYWSAKGTGAQAYYLYVAQPYLNVRTKNRPVGYSVRLVCQTNPRIRTLGVSGVSSTGANVNAEVDYTGSTTVTERGVCWSTTGGPTVSDSYLAAGTGTGSFNAALTGLSAGTTYHVRAYAKIGDTYRYGNELTFTTYVPLSVSTADVKGITGSFAQCGGTVSGGQNVTVRGVCWSTSSNPTVNDNHTCDGSGDGSFSSMLDNLTAGTSYYVRAYATTAEGTVYGYSTSFTASDVVNVTTASVTDINFKSATCGGTVSNNGGSIAITDRGVCWGTSSNPTVSGNHTTNGSGSGSFTVSLTNLEPGITYYVRAYATTANGTTYGSQQYFTTPVPTGAINGLFSVSSTEQVFFSRGNLQYNANTNTWRFAPNQYNYIGNANSNISLTYNGWIDLFGWGTSGYAHGAVCYHPCSTSQTDSDYTPYGGWNNLYDQTGKADWGYNAISNGGNETNQWHTPTHNEWMYVFNTRETTSGIRYAKAKVNNVNGVILLPDNWSTSYYTLNSTNTATADYTTNTINSSQWSTLEQHGAVFLPAAGYRTNGTSLYNPGYIGFYWSASKDRSDTACNVKFIDSNLLLDGFSHHNIGNSVRLVYPAQ